VIDETAIAARYQAVSPLLDERARRQTSVPGAFAVGEPRPTTVGGAHRRRLRGGCDGR